MFAIIPDCPVIVDIICATYDCAYYDSQSRCMMRSRFTDWTPLTAS